MKSHLKTGIRVVQEKEVFDGDTSVYKGSYEKKHTYIAGKDDFYLMYSYFIHVMYASKDAKIRLYAYLLEQYGSGVKFQIGLPLKREISKKIGVKEGTISNLLVSLKEDNLLFSPDRSLYMLNPRYIFKGSSKERNNKLKILIELGCDDC